MLDHNDPEYRGEQPPPKITELASDLLNESEEPGDDSLKTRWSVFYELWSRRLTRIAAETKAPRSQIEDLVQNVARKVLLRWNDFRHNDGARHLLALSDKMIHDEAVDLIRSLDRNPGAPMDSMPLEPIDSKVSNPADIAEMKELREGAAANLERLREKYPRYAWVLYEHFLEGRPIKQLAMEKGINEHAVRCTITRALRRMRSLMRGGNAGSEAAF